MTHRKRMLRADIPCYVPTFTEHNNCELMHENPTTEQVTGDQKKLHNEGLHDL
jgi:hypothetical protein